MHKVLFFIVVTIVITGYQAAAQAPGIKWQKTLGGTSFDNAGDADTNTAKRPKISLIDKNGYHIGANTRSTDGDISGNNGGTDLWIAKLDTQRNITWSTCLGGSDYEDLGSVQRVPDSGYIVAASTWSNNGKVSGNHGLGDVWIVRLGNSGNVVWQKCYGGSNVEEGVYIEKTADGYIMTGSTGSTDGDVTGLHGTNNFDIWVVKLDDSGAIVWQKCLGGTGEESGIKIKQTTDGGYIVLGRTSSTNGDVVGMHGTSDIWVVKLDSNGAIEWQKCLGGSTDDLPGDIILTSTGYIITGHTWSNNGDVSGNHGGGDGWVVNLSATGSVLWQRCYGGLIQDALSSIIQLPDNTYVAAGFTGSTNGDVSYNHGYYDYWLVNFSQSGTIIWEKTYGGSSWEGASVVGLNPAGNLVVLGSTWSNDQDVTGNHGQDDVWLFEAGTTNSITGQVFYDVNKNGIKDNGELAFDQVTVRAQKGSELRSSIPANGNYKIEIDTGSYIVNAVPYYNYYTIFPAQQNISHNTWFNTDVINFAVQPNGALRDVTVGVWSNSAARPGFSAMYTLYYRNVGVEPVLTGKIKMVKDHRISFTTATPAPASVNGDTVTWNFSNLHPNTSVFMYLNMQIGTMPAVNLGDTLKSVVWIEPDGIDITPQDDTMVLKQIVTGSFDPNDKTEANAGVITPAQVSNGEYLNYLIRFQNTGNDTAFHITVRDTLDTRLDWNTLQMIASSHSYQLSIEEGNKLAWQFNNILLPYINIDEPNSHGYIAYRIKPKSTVVLGDTIKNTAGIYFDFNLPIATNTHKTVVLLLTPLPVTLTSFMAAEDGDVVNVTWATSIEEHVKQFEVLRSSNGTDFITIGTVKPGKHSYRFTDKQPLKGYNYYRLRSVDADGTFSLSTIVLVNLKNGAEVISSLYPNPGNGNVTLKLQGAVKGNVLVQVLNQQGRFITTKQFGEQDTAEFRTPLDLGRLAKGNYVLRIQVNDRTYLHKILIQ
jgi:uncharacterized repeat protein (TIGR01451 family)